MMNKNTRNILVLIILSYFFFFCGNSLISLTNPDEVFYAQTAKEMAQHKSWMTPILFDQPQFEKPILTYWLLRIIFAIWGITAFSARFFPAFFALLGIIAVYLLALFGYKDTKKAFLSALILCSSGFYIGLARTVFTDMIFSVFILMSLASFFASYVLRDKKSISLILFFLFSALAVLTKGPLGFFIPSAAVILFLIIRKEIKFILCKSCLFGFLIFLLIWFPWYAAMIKEFGNSFTKEFIYNDHIRRIFTAEHSSNDTWYFYPFSLVSGMFPWSIFVLVSFFHLFKKLKEKTYEPIYLFLASWVFATFIIFQFAHSKLVSYIFPMFPALAIMAGDFILSRPKNRALKAADNIGGRSSIPPVGTPSVSPGGSIFEHTDRIKSKISLPMFISWFTLLSIPAGVVIAYRKYPAYFVSFASICEFLIIFSLFMAGLLIFIFKRKHFLCMCMLSCAVPGALFFALSSHNGFEAHVSSKRTSDYLLKNYNVENTIVCAQPFVRGVRFWTDKDVAVINIGGGNFFSPHPIPYLDSDEKVREFFEKQRITYCIITKSLVCDLERIVGKEFRIDSLKTIGNEFLVRVEQR